MRDKIMRIGIIGFSMIVRDFHYPILQKIPGAKVAAICRRNIALLKEEIGDTSIRIYHDYKEMLKHETLDCVYIASPTSTHKEMTLAALTKGLHVFCEKPPAFAVSDLQEMLAMAEMNNRILQFGFNRRFAPMYRKMKQIVEQKKIDLILLQKSRGERISENSPEHLRDFAQRNGPPVFEFMGHLIDLAQWLAGPVGEYKFHHGSMQPSCQVATFASGIMIHTSGTITLMYYNTFSGQRIEKVTVHCGETTVEFCGGMFETSTLSVINADSHRQSFTSSRDPLTNGGFFQQTESFINSINTNTPPPWTNQELIDTLALTIAFDGTIEER